MSEKELEHQVVDEDHKTQIHEEFTPSDKKETYILKATEDMFDGIIVDPTGLPKDIPTFVKSLKISLEFWKSQNKKGVWLKLPIANSNLVQPALQVRFSETIVCLCTNFQEVLIDANHWPTYSTLS
jgi:hypothetical protein